MDISYAADESSIYLWAFATVPEESVASSFLPFLSEEEKARAERFKFAHLKHSYTICRGLVRVLLGRYLKMEPNTIDIRYRTKGKPYIVNPWGIDFNVSHTSGMMLCGVTRGCEIGVDIERLRHFSNMQDLARRFFCTEEADELMSVPENERAHAFYRCWTRKESYIKAIGEGLSVSLDSFRVTLRSSEEPKLLHIQGDLELAERWRLAELDIDQTYFGAIAYPGPARIVRVMPRFDPLAFLLRGDNMTGNDTSAV